MIFILISQRLQCEIISSRITNKIQDFITTYNWDLIKVYIFADN